MALYTFRCPSCDAVFESVEKSETKESECPSCGAKAVRANAVELPSQHTWSCSSEGAMPKGRRS